MMALTLLVGGVAACGGDDDGGDDTAEEGGDGDDGTGSGNAAIDDYCAAVQEVVDKSAELQDDPTNADLQAEVTQLSTDLAVDAQNLAGGLSSFSTEEAEAFQGCQTDFGGIGG